ncbi:MAG TPA: hypothetical protein VMA36_12890 [Candidatus Limnocylindria bacterium]|jgi:hypothetical protein|nr:hypothetical protein [Candidatus Limnocylindria bacterium]
MRPVPLVVLLLSVVSIPLVAQGQPKPPPPSPAAAASEGDVREGGVIEGRVASIDYQRGTLSVDTSRQGRMDVSVMPSTTVQSSDPGYHTLSDVSRGSKVQIFISRSAGRLIAQIIRLIKH